MMSSGHISPRSITTTAAGLDDADGIVLALGATPVVLTNLTGAALDGAVQADGFGFPRYIVVVAAASAATYNTTDPILVTGTRGGLVTTVSLLLTAAGGDETIVSDNPLETVTNIRIPAQLGAGGDFTFGVTDLGPQLEVRAGVAGRDLPYRRVKAGGIGDLVLGYGDGTTDIVTCVAGAVEDVYAYRVYATSTATPITVYL